MATTDNQQERSGIEWWISGFTDGEGCFSISIIRNKTTALGWQVFPEYVVTQGEKSIKALEIMRDYFDCGGIFVNKRYDNHNSNLYRFCIRSVKDLREKVVPFFRMYPLRTEKRKDFEIFASIVESMAHGEHLSMRGITKIAKKIERMNRKKVSRFLESSEAIRQPSSPSRGEKMRWSGPCSDAGRLLNGNPPLRGNAT